jgi:hypothetical protein
MTIYIRKVTVQQIKYVIMCNRISIEAKLLHKLIAHTSIDLSIIHSLPFSLDAKANRHACRYKVLQAHHRERCA